MADELVTAAVGALVAGALDPEPFVAMTETVRVLPTSAATGTYVADVAPLIAVPARFHW